MAGVRTAQAPPSFYNAENTSLAVVEEILMQPEATALLQDYVLYRVEFEEDLEGTLDETLLPDDWRAYPAPAILRAIGDAWLAEARSAMLSVPSVIVPLERLYLLNLRHADFTQS